MSLNWEILCLLIDDLFIRFSVSTVFHVHKMVSIDLMSDRFLCPRGNVALSVLMTAASTFAAAVIKYFYTT